VQSPVNPKEDAAAARQRKARDELRKLYAR
jgi:hypothetical protein